MDIEIVIAYIQVIVALIILLIIIKKLYWIYSKSYIVIRNLFIKKNSIKDLKQLNREINVDYSPAVLSYLMNQEIEPKKDIIATLLNLYDKKTINIEKQGKQYVFLKGCKEENLNPDEKYIYDCCLENKKINIEYWIKIIKEEYFKYCFSKEKESQVKKEKKYKKIFTVLTIVMALLFYKIINQNELIYFLACLSVSIFVNFIMWIFSLEFQRVFIDNNIYLTKKGKEEIKKWLKFKKFINEYTLIEERTIEETIIFEKYIPYAMALNINKDYQNKKLNMIDIDEFSKYIISNEIVFLKEIYNYISKGTYRE